MKGYLSILVMWLTASDPGESASCDFGAAIEAALPRVVKLYGAKVGHQPGYGAGVLVSPDGKVVTTLSYLLEAQQIRVVTSDGRLYAADVVFRDPKRQLALLRLQTPQGVDAIELPHFKAEAENGPRVGDWVIAVSNPFKVADGAEPLSIAVGVFGGWAPLKARQRLETFPYQGEVLVIDAITATPGSAGGALVDVRGRWLGVLGETVASRLTNTRLNYAIPVGEVAAFLRDSEAAQAAGVQTSSLRPETIRPGFHGIILFEMSYRRNRVFVETVSPGSPAEAAGVRPDDRIVSANGILVSSPRDFHRIADRLEPGAEMVLVVERESKLTTVRIHPTDPTERPAP